MADQSNAYAVVIADLKRQRDDIDAVIAQLEAMEGGSPIHHKVATVAKDETAAKRPGEKPRNNPYLGMSIVDATKELLALNRKPMRPADIVADLEAGGMVLTGTNKSNTIGSVLNRRQNQKGDVVSVKRGTWGLKEWYPGRTFGKKSTEESETNRESETEGTDASEPNEHEQPFEQPQIVPLRSND